MYAACLAEIIILFNYKHAPPQKMEDTILTMPAPWYACVREQSWFGKDK